ncbi:hypothetical protein C5S29_14260 [ANME-1 cluster archaeon GoMg3.2]|nr:hypothetical protein [ANME-1 cluster archaeon GoMg3.2]
MIIIIGAGLAGLSTGYHLTLKNANFKIYEMDSIVGGLCKSERINGFIFDYTGHLLHLHNGYVKKLLTKILGDKLRKIKRNSWIYSNGVYTPYPFQVNLYGLPPEVIKECIIGLIKAKYTKSKKEPISFEGWIYKHLGKGIAKHFMVPYNEKLWTVPPVEMTCDWLRKYVPNPSLEEVLDGALQPPKKDYGYNIYFSYPIHGGIETLPKVFAEHVNNIELNKRIIGIDTHKKIIELNDGKKESYDILISTMPLPELIKAIRDVPSDIEHASSKLNYASVRNINLGVKRQKLSEKHWIYFPEKEFIFYRAGFMSNFSPNMAPKDMSSIYVEISYSKNKPINEKNTFERVVEDLVKCNILRPTDEIVAKCQLDIKYAYVIYDKSYREIVGMIHNYLKNIDIYSIGRFGKWEYSAMEDAIFEGKEVADKLVD